MWSPLNENSSLHLGDGQTLFQYRMPFFIRPIPAWKALLYSLILYYVHTRNGFTVPDSCDNP